MTSEFDPIFVHASMRSGSTYFFNVLRRNETLLCFNESIMDGRKNNGRAKSARNRPESHSQTWDANHHFFGGPYFHELIAYLSALMAHAQSHSKRPVLCEVSSRGRAGALRSTFGGFHIAQYRDPLSQFGSYIRALVEGRTWTFLGTPLIELGASGNHPLCRLIPEQWRIPALPWRTKNKAQFWASNIQYFALVSASEPKTIERVFRWHLFSWVLSNVAALSYSDLSLDIDKAHDDPAYRASLVATLAAEIGVAPDFSDIRKFDRYYAFESFETAEICDQVVSAVHTALDDGRLDAAIRTLGKEPPLTSIATAAELLLEKIHASLASMMSSAERRRMSAAEWQELAAKNRKLWHKPGVRWIAERIYPVAEPIVRKARLAGSWV